MTESAAKTQGTDFSLLLASMEKRILEGNITEEDSQTLANEKIWERLEGRDAVRWARMAQMAGMVDLGLRFLEWVNHHRPELEEAWQERLEILTILDRREEVVRVRALAGARHKSKAMPPCCPGEKEDGEDSVATEGPLTPTNSTPETKPLSAPSEEPFLELRREEKSLSLFMEIFQGRRDVFARQWVDAKSSSQGYAPIRRPFLPVDVRDHLKGKNTYGIYLMREDDTVMVGVIDVDLSQELRNRSLSRDERLRVRSESRYLLKRLLELSHQHSLPCVLEFSGGKGYHAWYPLEKPAPAFQVRKALLHLAGKIHKDLHCFQLEVFPKQDRLTGAGLGNLVKLPLGVHRVSGKPSCFLQAPDRSLPSQLEYLQGVARIKGEALRKVAASHDPPGTVVAHPRYAEWAGEYPELARLDTQCVVLAHILAQCRSSRTLSLREEKILLGTLGFLPRARAILHHVFSSLPEYNRPLLDYKISRIRGTVLGCKRIHSLSGDGEGGIPCRFDSMTGYAHPLLHLETEGASPVEAQGERTVNLQDALENLATAMKQVQRFLSARGN